MVLVRPSRAHCPGLETPHAVETGTHGHLAVFACGVMRQASGNLDTMKVCLQELVRAATPAPEARTQYADDYEML